MIVSWIGRLSTVIFSFLLVKPCLAIPEVIVNSDRVDRSTIKLRLTATDEGELLPNLTKQDFDVISDGQPVPIKSLIPPKKNRPTPTRLVILLDMSNSMTSQDTSGQTRQEGAIIAIRAILTEFQDAPLEINIIPFGQGGEKCKVGDFIPNSISSYLKAEKFFPPNSQSLTEQLDQLTKAKLCASTNLYDPLTETINYLQQEGIRINQEAKAEKKLPTRFGMILLSDGFHSNPPRKCGKDYEPKRFEKLTETINEAVPKIRIHTLGYGLTPDELANKWGLSRRATVEDVICPFGNENRAREFVDQERLAEIAKLGRGIHHFSGNGAEIAKQLEESVRTILGEYELVFVQPNALPAKRYDIKVRLNLKSDLVESSTYYIRLDPWVEEKPLPILLLLGASLVAIGGTIGGYKKYRDWSNKLREEM